jgi:hypothetical protein
MLAAVLSLAAVGAAVIFGVVRAAYRRAREPRGGPGGLVG